MNPGARDNTVHLFYVRRAFKKHISDSERVLDGWFRTSGPGKAELSSLPGSLRECMVQLYAHWETYARLYQLPYATAPSWPNSLHKASLSLLSLVHASSIYRSPYAAPPFSAASLWAFESIRFALHLSKFGPTVETMKILSVRLGYTDTLISYGDSSLPRDFIEILEAFKQSLLRLSFMIEKEMVLGSIRRLPQLHVLQSACEKILKLTVGFLGTAVAPILAVRTANRPSQGLSKASEATVTKATEYLFSSNVAKFAWPREIREDPWFKPLLELISSETFGKQSEIASAKVEPEPEPEPAEREGWAGTSRNRSGDVTGALPHKPPTKIIVALGEKLRRSSVQQSRTLRICCKEGEILIIIVIIVHTLNHSSRDEGMPSTSTSTSTSQDIMRTQARTATKHTLCLSHLTGEVTNPMSYSSAPPPPPLHPQLTIATLGLYGDKGFACMHLSFSGLRDSPKAFLKIAEASHYITIGSREMEDDMARHIVTIRSMITEIIADVESVRLASQAMVGDLPSLDKGSQASTVVRCRLYEFAHGIGAPARRVQASAGTALRALEHAFRLLNMSEEEREQKGRTTVDDEEPFTGGSIREGKGTRTDDPDNISALHLLVRAETKRLQMLRKASASGGARPHSSNIDVTSSVDTKDEVRAANEGYGSNNDAPSASKFMKSIEAEAVGGDNEQSMKGGQNVALVYENQRFRMVKGWSGDLDAKAGDPLFSFSDETGRVKLEKRFFSLPPGWRWESEWRISGMGVDTDEEGWRYGRSFKSEIIGNGNNGNVYEGSQWEWQPKKFFKAKVRRRVWERVLIRDRRPRKAKNGAHKRKKFSLVERLTSEEQDILLQVQRAFTEFSEAFAVLLSPSTFGSSSPSSTKSSLSFLPQDNGDGNDNRAHTQQQAKATQKHNYSHVHSGDRREPWNKRSGARRHLLTSQLSSSSSLISFAPSPIPLGMIRIRHYTVAHWLVKMPLLNTSRGQPLSLQNQGVIREAKRLVLPIIDWITSVQRLRMHAQRETRKGRLHPVSDALDWVLVNVNNLLTKAVCCGKRRTALALREVGSLLVTMLSKVSQVLDHSNRIGLEPFLQLPASLDAQKPGNIDEDEDYGAEQDEDSRGIDSLSLDRDSREGKRILIQGVLEMRRSWEGDWRRVQAAVYELNARCETT
eukprot:CAMPEP_0114502584 /NCGR_PEP_ID=MMETSP0109-20121206/9176_1 /TAXON_ID=29199 /ORGANISM="Chlorarachnion reptans, Strain CCCM449" /LENGTH=1155 /DNA_ID=CAMNT_0001680523 /DNA_START=580 /DNA_END=4044 /DNA_ORIENTATION=-